jgi:hypothetical protein
MPVRSDDPFEAEAGDLPAPSPAPVAAPATGPEAPGAEPPARPVAATTMPADQRTKSPVASTSDPAPPKRQPETPPSVALDTAARWPGPAMDIAPPPAATAPPTSPPAPRGLQHSPAAPGTPAAALHPLIRAAMRWVASDPQHAEAAAAEASEVPVPMRATTESTTPAMPIEREAVEPIQAFDAGAAWRGQRAAAGPRLDLHIGQIHLHLDAPAPGPTPMPSPAVSMPVARSPANPTRDRSVSSSGIARARLPRFG